MSTKPVFFSRSQICDQAWDNHITQSRQCVVYALSWYLDIVCEQWEALVWYSATGSFIAMPLPIKSRFGKRILYQPLFCQYLGIFSNQDLTADQTVEIFQALANRYDYISSYSFNPENTANLDCNRCYAGDFVWETRTTHWLDLQMAYPKILKGYTNDRKINLQRGAPTGWEFAHSNDFGPLIGLFTENHAAGIGRIHRNAFQILSRLGRCCGQRGIGTLTYAASGGRIHAGIWLVRYNGRTIYLFNAADQTGRKGNARAVMLNAYFEGNAGTDLIFDFESPQKKSIAKYYKDFGATAVPFLCMHRNVLPFAFRQIQQFRKWLLIRTS
ncbi:hypothetical protein LZD49_10155 [Dyadobacter sp. CY261]|uniref:hypothetical protein n=1 Tax=Dyadobacter sp. CY261 TaxID=2907203 RepID=UPI001F3A55F3|nr:hypothetical protein [Dyadobacter sp. CY261]MCF0070835.1 hypothetical protein [Dyadobacter sp. CY261]